SRLGFLLLRSNLDVHPPGIIGRLVGNDADVALGSRDGGVWTDLPGAIDAPPIDLTRDGVAQYRRPDSAARIGALVGVRGPPRAGCPRPAPTRSDGSGRRSTPWWRVWRRRTGGSTRRSASARRRSTRCGRARNGFARWRNTSRKPSSSSTLPRVSRST